MQLAAALLHPASALRLAVFAAPLVLLAGWLLAAPDCVVSRLMTWDLLFNLEGAWRLHAGQVPHVDFHDPLGSLAFWPTAIGFRLIGPTVHAFILGKLLTAAVVFACAVAAASGRLALVPGALFVVIACQLVLVPINVGSLVDHFTFGMSYNALGWALLGILSLILFLPGDRPAREGWVEAGMAGVLLVALHYLKITYFLAAMGEVALALVVCRHVRSAAAPWAAMLAIVLAIVLGPHNWAYLADIWATVEAGGVRRGGDALLVLVTANATELSLHAGLLLLAVALWRTGLAPLRLPVAVAALIVAAVAVLSQNAQLRGLPLGMVAVFLVYDQIRRHPAWLGRTGTAWVLVAVLSFPLATAVAGVLSVGAYFAAAQRHDGTYVVERSNMRGLAVPIRQDEAVANQDADYTWGNHARSIAGDPRLSQYKYVQTILEAAAMFDQRARRPGRVLVLDQVSPLSFVLGRPPPRGVTLWMDTEFPWRPAAVLFGEVDYVLIPKLSTYAELTDEAVTRYGAYLQAHFPIRSESPHWILLSRRLADS